MTVSFDKTKVSSIYVSDISERVDIKISRDGWEKEVTLSDALAKEFRQVAWKFAMHQLNGDEQKEPTDG